MRRLSLESLERRELKTVDTGFDLTAETETSTAAFVKFDGIDGELQSVDTTSSDDLGAAEQDPDAGVTAFGDSAFDRFNHNETLVIDT